MMSGIAYVNVAMYLVLPDQCKPTPNGLGLQHELGCIQDFGA